MSHPCVVTLDRHSKPRTLFSGNRLVEVELPAGARCIYPKPPLEPVPDLKAAIEGVLHHPLNCEPLTVKLARGMKVTIAIDDISAPVPPMKRPDVRATVLGVLLPLLENHGVNDVEIIVATGLRRRLKPREIEEMVGTRIFKAYFPKRLYNHDAEDPRGMLEAGKTEQGEVVELHRRALESDLLIRVTVCSEAVPRSDDLGILALSSYRTLRTLYDPRLLADGHDYLEPARSRIFEAIERMQRVLEARLNLFTIGIVLDNRVFDSDLEFLTKNEDELMPREQALQGRLLSTSARLPVLLRQLMLDRAPAPYGVIGVFAGESKAVQHQARELSALQHCVPIEGQADVLVSGIPHIGPYNVHAFMNPLLVQMMAEGYLFNTYRGAPLVKRGGTLIITHPCTDKFDHEQHAAHRVLVHRLLPETNAAQELHLRYQEKLATDPALIEMFRRGHAYHPTHPFFSYYAGEAARRYLGKVIVVGADNEYIPKLLGYETAVTMAEALYRARGDSSRHLEIVCLRSPPLVVPDVTPLAGASLARGAQS